MECCNFSNWFAFFSSLLFLTLFLCLKQSRFKIPSKQQPPGPPAWPVVRNIFDLGSNLHQSLYRLSFKYGDLVWLRLGWTNTLVIQTANASEELFKNHDASFCDRRIPESWTAHNYAQGSIAIGVYGSNWRILRRLVTSALMTSKQIQDTAFLRRKCIDNMVRYIEEDSTTAQRRGESGEVELSKYVFVMVFNLIGNLVLSRDLVNSQSEEGNEFFRAMDKVMEFGGKPNLSDFYPFLKRFDLQRIKKHMERHLGRALTIVEKFVMERVEESKLIKERECTDLLDTLLEYNELGDDEREGEEKISIQNILIIILEMFMGATESMSSTIEWAMTELFCNPESMKMVKEELTKVIGPKRKIEESHIDQLPYLQAVIKETMRLHPVMPFLGPRNSLKETIFMGYLIPKDTQVFVNAWAIGRDPNVWKDPLSFRPERFLGLDIHYRGQHFELIPFGSGRRMCVGYPLAHKMLPLTLASLLHCFNWELDSKSIAEAMDSSERLGITVRKLIPLKTLPKKKILVE